MNNELRNVAENMRELGLGALTHANRHAAYQDIVNDKWAELSVLQAAHAAEILIKAKIAEEHPLLIFEKFPKITDDNLSLLSLFEDGHTIEWSQLPNRLWATTSMHLPNKDVFIRFGKLRNSIQHFGAIPKDVNASLETWGGRFTKPTNQLVYDFNASIKFEVRDYDSYENFPPILIDRKIEFLVSPRAAEYHEFWDSNLQKANDTYRLEMEKRIQDSLNKTSL